MRNFKKEGEPDQIKSTSDTTPPYPTMGPVTVLKVQSRPSYESTTLGFPYSLRTPQIQKLSRDPVSNL